MVKEETIVYFGNNAGKYLNNDLNLVKKIKSYLPSFESNDENFNPLKNTNYTKPLILGAVGLALVGTMYSGYNAFFNKKLSPEVAPMIELGKEQSKKKQLESIITTNTENPFWTKEEGIIKHEYIISGEVGSRKMYETKFPEKTKVNFKEYCSNVNNAVEVSLGLAKECVKENKK